MSKRWNIGAQFSLPTIKVSKHHLKFTTIFMVHIEGWSDLKLFEAFIHTSVTVLSYNCKEDKVLSQLLYEFKLNFSATLSFVRDPKHSSLLWTSPSSDVIHASSSYATSWKHSVLVHQTSSLFNSFAFCMPTADVVC